MWGWNALTPAAPLEEASTDADVKRYIVLFSDAENTRVTMDVPRTSSDFGKTSTGTPTASSNPEMLTACDNIKKAGINVIVFWYEMRKSSDDYVTKLKDCASKPEYFVNANPSLQGDLTAKFQSVSTLIYSDAVKLTQ